ncbi:hypothetical protein PR202_gb23861 [Eleusine coracana subsp. coracana]|uniref:Uncharacterized protein n=1 Tax=Eleusine coracana subsp. coracana TaxID=191504 RepID=A0AAV5FJY8_ELECO|nr:hypothetical protein PR202_gb23861 [Eleusine coracana subsp. coracana]
MGGEATSAGGGGFRARIDHYLYSGEKKHVLAGIVIFGAIFGVPWYFMTRGTKIILFPSHRILSTVPFLRIIAINFSKFILKSGRHGDLHDHLPQGGCPNAVEIIPAFVDNNSNMEAVATTTTLVDMEEVAWANDINKSAIVSLDTTPNNISHPLIDVILGASVMPMPSRNFESDRHIRSDFIDNMKSPTTSKERFRPLLHNFITTSFMGILAFTYLLHVTDHLHLFITYILGLIFIGYLQGQQQVNLYTYGLREPLKPEMELAKSADMEKAMSRTQDCGHRAIVVAGQAKFVASGMLVLLLDTTKEQTIGTTNSKHFTFISWMFVAYYLVLLLLPKSSTHDGHLVLHNMTKAHRPSWPAPHDEHDFAAIMDDALHIDDVLNSGVTHGFINVTVANDMWLPLRHALLALTLASGDRVTSRIICPKLPIVFHCDTFLGTPRLASLGPLRMDFIALCMSFFIDGRYVLLVGKSSILHPQPMFELMPLRATTTLVEAVIAVMDCPRRVMDIVRILQGDSGLYDMLCDDVSTDLELRDGLMSFDVNNTYQSFVIIFIFDWSVTVKLHQPPSVSVLSSAMDGRFPRRAGSRGGWRCYGPKGAKHQSHQDYMEKANKARSERLSSGQPSSLSSGQPSSLKE